MSNEFTLSKGGRQKTVGITLKFDVYRQVRKMATESGRPLAYVCTRLIEWSLVELENKRHGNRK